MATGNTNFVLNRRAVHPARPKRRLGPACWLACLDAARSPGTFVPSGARAWGGDVNRLVGSGGGTSASAIGMGDWLHVAAACWLWRQFEAPHVGRWQPLIGAMAWRRAVEGLTADPASADG